MAGQKKNKFLTVAPFECAWQNDLRFKEAGRGCVAFEAFADNDVTLVFREHVGGQRYHYKRDNSPHYTVILGSHRNKRLKIESDGKTVVDEEGIGLCSSSKFQSYWIGIYDGLISVGKGRYPFQNLVFQWLDSEPNYSVQYVGLSSWDKHVAYRNVSVLPLNQNHVSLWKQVECGVQEEDELKRGAKDDSLLCDETWGLENFLENWELSDMLIVVGKEEKSIPAHKVILASSGKFELSSTGQDVITLQQYDYDTVHAFLQYLYTGKTKVLGFKLVPLKNLALQFEVISLVKQCQEIIERSSRMDEETSDSGRREVVISYPKSRSLRSTAFTYGLPLCFQKLREFLETGLYGDVYVYIEDYSLVSLSHKLIMSLWSMPFKKMFTNGMSESTSQKICLREVAAPEAVKLMLEFMYTGELKTEDISSNGTLLLQLLLMADQFGIMLLQQECCRILLECLSEFETRMMACLKRDGGVDGECSDGSKDSVCLVLQVISSVPSCEIVEEACKRKLATQFDYCVSTSMDYVMLDEITVVSLLKHPDLTVTSEVMVLNGILRWCLRAEKNIGWEAVDGLLRSSTPEILFGQNKLKSLSHLLTFVRFPLMPYQLLKKMEKSSMMESIPSFASLVREAIDYQEFDVANVAFYMNLRFQHRRSSYKELHYIYDGDSNGVMCFAGTSYGEHQWLNPVLSKKISITASSPTSRFTNPKVLVSRTYQETSFAGPRVENGKKCSWWMVDLGQDHQLMCNYYTLRQDGSRAFIRNWALQGSMDGTTWTDLRVHDNDHTICLPRQFASWPVVGSSSLLPFRFFRVKLTGPTTDIIDQWKFCICYLELYGYFR